MAVLLAMESALAQGVLWGLMVLGVFLTFRILNIPDMTVDGSFATGGAVTAVLILKGMHPLVTLLFVFIAGLITGLITGLMNTKLKINVLLAGILSQIALYSINIRIMGKPEMSLLGAQTLVSKIMEFSKNKMTSTQASLVLGVITSAIIIGLLYYFFGTEIGSAIRATGNNENMVRALGVNTDTMKILGLMISNGIIALSGALVVQSQRFTNVGLGKGAIVIGLASIIIGEVIFSERFGFWWLLLSAVFGSIIYRLIVTVVLQLGLRSTDLNLFTAMLVAAALSVPVVKARILRRRFSLPGMNIEEEPNTRHISLKSKNPADPEEVIQ